MVSTAVDTAVGTRRSCVRLPYLPALDGLRGIALIAILLTHGGVERVRGGHLALTAFFTLSGFLITGLLLVERHGTGTIDLRVFWARRARRLVPALLLTFPLVAVVVLLAESPPGEALVVDAVAAATWVANWRFVLSEQSYADVFALPSPFQHFWSLAVEEQFYLVFPLVLLAVLGLRSARPRTGRLALLLGLLVVASTLQLARLHADGGVLGRAYYGTDARLAEILVGSLLALAMVGPQGLRPMSRPVRVAVSTAGVVGLLGLGWLVLTLEKDDPLAYRGGFLLAAVCTAAIVASGVLPGSPVTRLLSLRPLVWLGLISYGVYLFHWPLFLLLTERYTGLGTVPLLALRLGSVVLLAWLSLVLLERPVRSGNLPALPALGSWATGTTAGVVLVVAASATITLAPAPAPVLVQDASPAGDTSLAAPVEVLPEAPVDPTAAPPSAAAAPPPPVGPAAAAAPAPVRAAAPALPQPAPPPGAVPAPFIEKPADVPAPTVPPRQSAGIRVAVVGDSISKNLGDGLRLWAQRDQVALDVVLFSIGGCPMTPGADRRISADQSFPVDPACFWWNDPTSQRYAAYQQLDPHVVLVEAGISEVFDRRRPQWDDWRSPGHPQFDSWLVEQYQSSLRTLQANGAELLLANAVCGDWDRFPHFRTMDDGEGNLRARAVNLAYARLLGVELVDLHGRVCPNGQYRNDVEGVPNGRDDGFHFTDPAAEALARNWLGAIVLDAGRRGSTAPMATPTS